MSRLKRVDCSAPGILRVRSGRGWKYVDVDGSTITDIPTRSRIQALVIPPAWRDVWICPQPNGHIQATGFDARGRRQYRYHDAWRVARDREKFDHMLEFGAALPAIRQAVRVALASGPALSRDRVLACSVRLLDLGFFRIGTEGYAEENDTYGLATMLKSHVTLNGQTITFDFPAKGSKRRVQSVVDADVYDIVRRLKRRRGGGPELLGWQQGRRWCDVRSTDINEYIKAISAGDFTAKDFRTWNATVLAAVALAASKRAASTSGRKRAIARAMQEVSHYLGNTPAVARASYVDPRVVDRYISGQTIALERIGEDALFGQPSIQGKIERAVLRLLDDREVRRRAS